MKLSIIIPVYNGEKFVEKCYASIMNQNLELISHEILFIDNNSKDASITIIQRLMHENPNIKLFNQPRQGEAQARNMGIEKATGDYLYQLDVDDEVFPKALNRMMTVLDTNINVDAVFGKMMKTDKRLSDFDKPLKESHEVTIYDQPYWGLEWFAKLGKVVGEGAFMHRKEVFETLGSYTEQLPIIGTDVAFDIKLGMTSTLAFTDTYIYLYYKHEVSLIQGVKKKMPRAFMVWPRLIKEHLPYYVENEVPARFKQLLFAQIYQSMGRQVQHTNGIQNRVNLKKQLLSEIKEIPVPSIIRFYLSILVVFPFRFVRKFYGFYIVRPIVKRIAN